MKKRILAWMLTLAMVLTIINLPAITVAAYDADTFEAEDAASFGGAGFANDHGGYTGTGFMAGFSETGRGITFENINVSESGYYALGIRYANGGDSKTLSVYTNDNTAEAKRLDFPRTWGWDYWGLGIWGYVYTNVYLQKGENTITIAYLEGDSGNINVDHIKLASGLLTIVDKTSSIVNNGFDTGNTDGWLLWDNGNPGYGVDGGDTAEGSHKLYFWTGEAPYQQRISQTVTGLENGTYRVGLFIKISGPNDPNDCRLELTSYDGDNETYLDFVKKPDNQNPYEWYEQEVVVKDGQLNIAVYCDSPGHLSVQLDAFRLYQVIDKNALNEAVKTAGSLNESDYTADSWNDFRTALNSARDVLDNPDATQAQTDEAMNELATAQSNLQEVTVEFTVSATAGENGSITPSELQVAEGGTATFTITPSEGYEIDAVTVTPEKEYSITGNTLTIDNVQSDLQVNVTFKQAPDETDEGILLDLDFSKYTGDGTEPATITDNTGNLTNLTSTLKAQTIRGRTGIRFTGSNKDEDLIHWSASTYDPFNLASEGLTISYWINTQSRTRWEHILNYATGKNYIDDSGDAAYTANHFIMQFTDNERFLRTGITVNNDQTESYTGAKEIGKDRWAHITFTQDAVTKEVVIYVNGEQLHSFASNHSLYELSVAANANEKGPKSVNYFIGGPQLYAWDSDSGIDAVMSRFTIYNRALTAQEVADLYNPNQQNADYTAVHNAIDAAEQEIARDIYTEQSVAALIEAMEAVDWNKTVSEQAEVDAMAAAINDAIEALVKKTFTPDEIMQEHTHTDSDGTALPYRLYVPEDYDSSKDYPVLLVLHGAGERGTDNKKHINVNVDIINRIINSNNSDYDCIIVAPQCAEDFQWVDTDWSKGSYDQSKVAISKYLKATYSLLNEIKSSYSVDSNRLYITGLSMGGYGTWDFITRYPDLFAAAIPVCGAGDPTKAEVIKHMPIWVFHGDADSVVPVQGSRDMVDALEALDSPVRYTEYEGVGHDCWNNAYAETELLSWLFAQSSPSLSSIEVTTLPDKTVYNEGEEFDPTGMVVTAYYDDGSSKVVTDYIIDGYDSTPGTKTIIITYGDEIALFEVTVISEIIPGDVNGDGKVTVTDIIGLRAIIMSGEQPTQDQLNVADLDGDEKLTVTDVVALRKIIMSSES